MIPAVAEWLRNDLPRLAAAIADTDGLDIDDADEDRHDEFIPEPVEEILGTPLILDADGQTAYWRPEDKDRAAYGDLIYRDTAAATFLRTWNAFVNRRRNTAGELRGMLELTAARLERPDTDLVADLKRKPNEAQSAALKHLRDAVDEQDAARTELSRADQRVAEQVRQCLTVGVPAIELATRLGVTRARIYQIRDGRR